ncbi:MAG: hypothetical protein HY751_01490 [Nitrospinae bacterium]|nr:hypothetical protein [Nitrospinota bacterium]
MRTRIKEAAGGRKSRKSVANAIKRSGPVFGMNKREDNRSPKHSTRTRCYHCGGLLKYDPDGSAACVMCGRDMNHQCANCIDHEKHAA